MRQIQLSTDPQILKPIIEAMVFASEEPLSPRVLVRLLAGEREAERQAEVPPLMEMMENEQTQPAPDAPSSNEGGEEKPIPVETAEESVGGDEVTTAEEEVTTAAEEVETAEEMVETPAEEGESEEDRLDGGKGTIDAAIELAELREEMEDDEEEDGEQGAAPMSTSASSLRSEEQAGGEEGSFLSYPAEEDPGALADAMERADAVASGRYLRSNSRGTIDQRYLRQLIDELNGEYEETNRAFRIVEVAGGFQFATMREYGEYVALLSKEKSRRRLSPAALETLAIIAYRQPVAKPEIEAIRGVNCDQVLLSLLEKNLVAITGRSEGVGRPLLYGSTDEFLRCFGLNSISDLPKLREIEELMQDDAHSADKVEVVTVEATSNVEEIEAMVGAAGHESRTENGERRTEESSEGILPSDGVAESEGPREEETEGEESAPAQQASEEDNDPD